ncbi:Smr/MutS family protein [Haliangium ochraceum]|uniref:Smr protein/MutS2 n=1 Tax=Haliangium ochraceum (strain DSM 14365 / JCM 11303 / SMP-2) TaxID=502025 RepID=D0LN79_HALO1|nr:Smr/MutS family protein [Haliangium ochraceum]ACY15256.1 Smr protein/MutS2 [Haliangium ochraceum DSM 14365]
MNARPPSEDEEEDDDDEFYEPEVMEVELSDELDLHTFAPRDVADLVSHYVDECAERGFERVRIVHGKGKGTLRRTVHAVLERHPRVLRYALADGSAGSWGATFAWLSPPP